MIKFLLRRPIAVLMAFTACFIIGLVTYSTLPVSLLPDIAIPEITVQVSAANTPARELENTIVKPLRSQLIQVSTLKDIHSESRDGAGIIRARLDDFRTFRFLGEIVHRGVYLLVDLDKGKVRIGAEIKRQADDT
ncbi:efflux RND transporter permease subunit, partial [Bacteroides caecimuris]|uniref:efflux RND transporter permease subunit n=1 Tax=Bacteroides caecimuris TaxID=1796613 RepID=UPI0015D5E7BE